MSKILSLKKASSPPPDEPWVWHTRELLTSPSWRCKSALVSRLLEFLEIEHMNHAGSENGFLLAPYSQLHEFGISRKYVRSTIVEAQGLKLLDVKRGSKKSDGKNNCNAYRLTYLSHKASNAKFNSINYLKPTNEWKRVTEGQAEKIVAEQKKNRQRGSKK